MAAKNKTLNYLLIGVVAVVWGLIIYKLFLYLTFKEEEEVETVIPPIKKASADDYAMTRDTTSLTINFRDPFSPGRTEKDSVAQPVNAIKRLPPSGMTAATKSNWDFIQYEGFIKSPDTKQIIALVRINGKSLMLAEGEAAEHVRLLKNLRDSVKISSGGKVAFIHLKKP